MKRQSFPDKASHEEYESPPNVSSFPLEETFKRIRTALTGENIRTASTPMPKWKDLYDPELECSLEYVPLPRDFKFKKIISLSLFRPLTSVGSAGHKYIAGAQQFVSRVREEYPGWGLRIYHDASLAEDPDPKWIEFIRSLKDQGSHIQLVKFYCPAFREPTAPHYHQNLFSAMSRFLAWFDPNVDVVAFRDIDFTPNFEDYLVLEDFVKTKKPIGYYSFYKIPPPWLNCIDPWPRGYPPIAGGTWMARRAKHNYWKEILELATLPEILECLDRIPGLSEIGKGYGMDEVTLNLIFQKHYRKKDFVEYGPFDMLTANLRTAGGDRYHLVRSTPRINPKSIAWGDIPSCGVVKDMVEWYIDNSSGSMPVYSLWNIARVLLFCRASLHWIGVRNLIAQIGKEKEKSKEVEPLVNLINNFQNLGVFETLKTYAEEYIEKSDVEGIKNLLLTVYVEEGRDSGIPKHKKRTLVDLLESRLSESDIKHIQSVVESEKTRTIDAIGSKLEKPRKMVTCRRRNNWCRREKAK